MQSKIFDKILIFIRSDHAMFHIENNRITKYVDFFWNGQWTFGPAFQIISSKLQRSPCIVMYSHKLNCKVFAFLF